MKASYSFSNENWNQVSLVSVFMYFQFKKNIIIIEMLSPFFTYSTGLE